MNLNWIKKISISGILIFSSSTFTLYISDYILSKIYVLPNKLSRIASTGSYMPGGNIDSNQYEFKTNMAYNSNGFREVELSTINLSENKKRILFLGDSFGEGWGVEKNERISDLVIDKLNQIKNNNIGINLGQLATQPISYYFNLMDFGIALKPDIVVFTFFSGNDFMVGRTTKINTKYKINYNIETFYQIPFSNFFTKIKLNYIGAIYEEFIKKKSILVLRKYVDNYWEVYYKAKIDESYMLKRLQMDSKTFRSYLHHFEPWFIEASLSGSINPGNLIDGINNLVKQKEHKNNYYNQKDYDNVIEIIKETKKIVNQHNSKFVILLIPSIYDVHYDKFTKHLQDNRKYTSFSNRFEEAKSLKKQLIDDMQMNNIDIIDMTSIYARQNKDVFHIIDAHLNKFGHKLASDELVKYIMLKK